MVLDKVFKISSKYFRYFVLSSLGKGHGPSFAFETSYVEFGQMVLENTIFKNFVSVFLYFLIISLKKGMTLHLTKLESNALCQVVLRKELKKKFLNIFWLFLYYLPLENGMALHLNNLEYP